MTCTVCWMIQVSPICVWLYWHTSCMCCYVIPAVCDGMVYRLGVVLYITSCIRWYGILAVCNAIPYQLYAMVWCTGCVWCYILPAVFDGMANWLCVMLCHTSCMRWYGILTVCNAMSYQLTFIRRIFCCKCGNNKRWNKNNIYGVTAVSYILKNELKDYSLLCHV
jgi:hypothetical protein